jgi:hypothetical protein
MLKISVSGGLCALQAHAAAPAQAQHAFLDSLPLLPWLICKQPRVRKCAAARVPRRAMQAVSETPGRCTETASSFDARVTRAPAALGVRCVTVVNAPLGALTALPSATQQGARDQKGAQTLLLHVTVLCRQRT